MSKVTTKEQMELAAAFAKQYVLSLTDELTAAILEQAGLTQTLQTEVDGKVGNDAESVTDGGVAVFDGETGKLVKDSGFGIGGADSTGAVWGYIPLVKTDGGIEIGKYIDFHLTSDDGIDRYSRIMISSGEDQPIFTFSGSSSSEGAIIKADQVHANQYHGTYYGTLGYPAKVTLNGVEFSYAATNASATSFADGLIFYAPTTAGEENQILISDSDGKPAWSDSAPLATAFKTGDVTITFAQFYAAFGSALTSLQTELGKKVNLGDGFSVVGGIITVKDGNTVCDSGVTLSDLQSIADDVYSEKMDKQNELLSAIVAALQ